MSQELEKTLSDLNSGRMADLVLMHLAPMFDLLRKSHLDAVKQEYRAGKFDPGRVQSKIAALCDLDDLEAQLKRQVARGQRAAEANHGKGTHDQAETSRL